MDTGTATSNQSLVTRLLRAPAYRWTGIWILVLVLVTQFAGCSSTIRAEYPYSLWGDISKASLGPSCNLIAGSYRNIGERAPHRLSDLYQRPSLSELLLGHSKSNRNAVFTIESLANATLRLKLIQNSAPSEKTIILTPIQQLDCEAGFLRLHLTENVPPIGEGEGYRRVTDLHLSLTGNRSLAVREVTVYRGLNFDLVPYRDKVDLWYRFPPLLHNSEEENIEGR